MTISFDDNAAPIVVAALVVAMKPRGVCPRCFVDTADVHADKRTMQPSWPCRPCRRETQAIRDYNRVCSVGRCKRKPRHGNRMCDDHRPRFG